MHCASDQILTVAQMRAAEEALIMAGTSVDQLMRFAGRGAAEWVWRLSGGRSVTVLTGPGNNGGDGWVIAEALRARGGEVAVIAAAQPATAAAQNARALYKGEVLDPTADRRGEVLVDCLFGSGLTRPLSGEHAALLRRLAASHDKRVATDLPSGIDSDLGQPLGLGLPDYDLTIALGAWKFAHFLMPAAAAMGALRLVGIGVDPVAGAATAIARPRLAAPDADAHKYTRGLLAVVAGVMPGAALLACQAAQRAGAGYIKLFVDQPPAGSPADLVIETGALSQVLSDDRNRAILVGPGLGRGANVRERLVTAMADPVAAVLDADALVLLAPRLLAERQAPLIVTPHDGELFALERAFALDGTGSKAERAAALARTSGMIVVAKGADTVVAAPDGQMALAPRASSWLSTAGTGDVLAGVIASRLAVGAEPFAAACQGVWLHGEAARLAGPVFTAGQLAACVQLALATCLSTQPRPS